MKVWSSVIQFKKSIGTIVLSGFVLSLLAANSDAKQRARVYVDSFASDEYQESKEGAEGPAFETYHFFRGRYFGGNVADGSLKKVSFQDLIVTLADYMMPRNYFPADGIENGDLLIVVHYGVTGVEESWDELMGIDSFGGDDGGDFGGDDGSDFGGGDSYATTGQESFTSEGHEYSEAMNARMLGFNKALYKKSLSPQDEYDLRQELKDERYFIILMAFDYQHLRAAKEFKLLWSTRFSVNGIGTNFVEAHHTLSRAARGHFGTNLEDLESERTFHGEGSVEHGELEVIGLEE